MAALRASPVLMTARVLTGALTAALVALVLACGGNSGNGPDTTATTPGGSPAATAPGDGSTTPPPGGLIDLAAQAPLSIVYGAAQGDLPSDQPALATGDFDGDGRSDIAIGARFADPPAAGADAGSLYVVFGTPDLPAAVDLAEGQQGLTIVGPHAGANLGFSAAGADFNSDGMDDIAVGAAFAQTNGMDTGAVYVFFGPLPKDGAELLASDADVVISGESASGFFGDSLADGDVNADGISDLIVGATFDSDRHSRVAVRGGAVHVFFGRTGWPAQLSAGDAAVSIYGEDDLDELGDFVTSGDVSGDGRDDIIATAEAADGPENDRPTAAQVYVLFGREGLHGTYDVADDADVVIYGAKTQDTLGFSLATGDLNGDGTDDLAMGARRANGGGVSRTGVVYVLPGGDIPAEIDLAAPPDSVRAMSGAAAGNLLGLVYIADVDGDGRNELLAGARRASSSGRDGAGSIYIVSEWPDASITNIAEAASHTILGRSSGEALGGNARTADLNADGRPELIAVAENAPGPGDSRPGSGRIYIINVP